MRKYLFLLCGVVAILGVVISSCSKSMPELEHEYPPFRALVDSFYLSGGERIPLQRMDNKFYIWFYSDDKCRIKNELTDVGAKIDYAGNWRCHSFLINDTINKTGTVVKHPKMWAVIKGDNEQVIPILATTIYYAPFFKTESGSKISPTELFTVVLRHGTTLAQLEGLAKENSVEIIGRDRHAANRYHLFCTNHSRGNALQMANLFFESGLFEDAFPDFIAYIKFD